MLVDESDNDNVVDEVSSQDVVDLMLRVVDDDVGVLVDHEEVSLVELDVVDVIADQELLVGVERCLEGIEEVTNPNAVG